MGDVLQRFPEWFEAGDGQRYRAQACGRAQSDGRWEGWIEFVGADGHTVLRSRRETVQPNRADIAYWAGGLSTVYLEGSLQRTLEPPRRRRAAGPVAPSTFEGPALERHEPGSKPVFGRPTFEGPAPETGGERPIRSAIEAFDSDRPESDEAFVTAFCDAFEPADEDDPGEPWAEEDDEPSLAESTLMTRLLALDVETLRLLMQRCRLLRPGEEPDELGRREMALRLLLAARRRERDESEN